MKTEELDRLLVKVKNGESLSDQEVAQVRQALVEITSTLGHVVKSFADVLIAVSGQLERIAGALRG